MDSLKGDLMRLADDRPHGEPDATTVAMTAVAKRKQAKTPPTREPKPVPVVHGEPPAPPTGMYGPVEYRSVRRMTVRLGVVCGVVGVIACLTGLVMPGWWRWCLPVLVAAIVLGVTVVMGGRVHDRLGAVAGVAGAYGVAVVDMRAGRYGLVHVTYQYDGNPVLREATVHLTGGRAWLVDQSGHVVDRLHPDRGA